MEISIACAKAVRRLTGPGPLDAEAVCALYGVEVDTWHFRKNLEALYASGSIAVKLGLARPVREHRILHELGHHLIHGDHSGVRFWSTRDAQMLSKAEHQAEMFAYFVALPSNELAVLLRGRVEIEEIASRYTRTEEWVRERIRLEG
jgi:hypothetical protein